MLKLLEKYETPEGVVELFQTNHSGPDYHVRYGLNVRSYHTRGEATARFLDCYSHLRQLSLAVDDEPEDTAAGSEWHSTAESPRPYVGVLVWCPGNRCNYMAFWDHGWKPWNLGATAREDIAAWRYLTPDDQPEEDNYS